MQRKWSGGSRCNCWVYKKNTFVHPRTVLEKIWESKEPQNNVFSALQPSIDYLVFAHVKDSLSLFQRMVKGRPHEACHYIIRISARCICDHECRQACGCLCWNTKNLQTAATNICTFSCEVVYAYNYFFVRGWINSCTCACVCVYVSEFVYVSTKYSYVYRRTHISQRCICQHFSVCVLDCACVRE
jgi:hypothetical protein